MFFKVAGVDVVISVANQNKKILGYLVTKSGSPIFQSTAV